MSAAIIVTLSCGSPLQVVSGQDSNGWILIRSDYSLGWVGGVRLRAGSFTDPGVCAGAPYPPYSLGQYVRALVLSAQKAGQTAHLKLARKPGGLGSVEERLLSVETNIEQMMIVLQKLQC